MMHKREIRHFNTLPKLEIRTNADGSRSVAGYFATFRTLSFDLGGWQERIKPGAFARSLQMNTDVLALYNHNPDLVLGRTSANTLEVAEDAKGLRFSVRLPNTSYANDLVSLMERGDIAACSFAFVCVADSWANENGILIRTLEEVELIEGSIVGQPAYPNTVADLRSCPAQLRSMLPAKDKTKEVDGVELPASCFAYVGDPAETDTWKLPIHFPDDIEKTKSHIRNALARFNQTEGIPEDKRAEVYARIVGAAKAHGISVSKESLHEGTGSRSLEDSLRIKLWTASRQRNL